MAAVFRGRTGDFLQIVGQLPLRMEDVLAGLAADEGRSGGESEGEGAFLEFGDGRRAEAGGARARDGERKRSDE